MLMRKNKPALGIQDDGFTVIELLIALLLTIFVSGFLVQITDQATKSIGKISDSAVTVQSAIRYSNLIKYDFSGSQDVYVHSVTPPNATTNKSCNSFKSGSALWGAPTGLLPYVRGLFTLRVADVSYDRTSESNLGWQTISYTWVGYEIRQKAYSSATITKPSLELWRVNCADSSGIPATASAAKSQKLLDLGPTLASSVLSDAYIKCYDSAIDASGARVTILIDCRAGASPGSDVTTGFRSDYYAFELPYDKNQPGAKGILKQLMDVQYQQLRRRIDN
jgi:type II secretory pathway pseudopilin PulG